MILRNLLIALPTTLVCLALQVLFAYWGVRYYARHPAPAADSGTLASMKPLLVAMLLMMCGTIVQVTLWGLIFMLLGEFTELYEAIYHSAVNFASLGYGDIVMRKEWKLLGPVEALCGVLMLGMSAAALMAILQQMIRSQRESLGLR
jgi:hypothetical protein